MKPKYRIVETTLFNGTKSYEIQERILLFFYTAIHLCTSWDSYELALLDIERREGNRIKEKKIL